MTLKFGRGQWNGRPRWIALFQTRFLVVEIDTVWRGFRFRRDRIYQDTFQVRLGFVNALVKVG